MKRWLLAPLRLLWRMTLPLRRPILAKAASFIARSTYRPPHHCLVSEETGLVMNHMVRELVRLQQQVEHLQEALDDLAPHAGGLGVVGVEDDVRSAGYVAPAAGRAARAARQGPPRVCSRAVVFLGRKALQGRDLG